MRRASTAIPPAKANANGRNPAARRACEIETRSASEVKRNGTSITANTASEPPTTYAAHRLRAANPASGTSSSAPIATAPARVNTSAARLYEVSEWTTSWLPYCSNARCSSSASGETDRVSFTTGRSQSMKSDAGTTSAPSASTPSRRSARCHSARTRRKPTNGIQRKIAYVGCTTARTSPAAAVEATRPAEGMRTVSSASARAAGTSSCRDDVAGSERNTYAPPIPGAKAIIATCAAAVTPAAHVRRKSAQPASKATRTASGARIDGRWVTTRSGSSPATFAMSPMKPCQSGNA